MNKKYNIIYADPPWKYKDKTCDGCAEAHYKTMSIQDICHLRVRDICEKDCILFLWATYPMLSEALKTIEAWGFTYKTIGFQWIKQKWQRVLFGIRTLDAGQLRMLPHCNKRKNQTKINQRFSTGLQPSRGTLKETRCSSRFNCGTCRGFTTGGIIRKAKEKRLGRMGQ